MSDDTDKVVVLRVANWCINHIRAEAGKKDPDYEQVADDVAYKLEFLCDYFRTHKLGLTWDSGPQLDPAAKGSNL